MLQNQLRLVDRLRRCCQSNLGKATPNTSIEVVPQIQGTKTDHGNDTEGYVTPQTLSAADRLPELAGHDLSGTVPLPRPDKTEFRVETGAASPDVGETVATTGSEGDTEDVGERGGDIHILCELVGVTVVFNSVKDTSVRGAEDTVVPLIVDAEGPGDTAEEIGREQHGLEFRERGNGAESGTNEADEGDGGVVGLPDAADVGVVGGRVRATVLVVRGVEEGEGRDIAGGEDDNVGFDDCLVDLLGLDAIVQGEVGDSVRGEVCWEGRNFDGSGGRGIAGVEKEAADANR